MKPKTSSKKTTKELTPFEEIFLGEYVEILIKMKNFATEETHEGIRQMESSTIVKGYVLGVDEKYYYLGNVLVEGVTHAIAHSEVILMTLSEPKDKYSQILDDFSDEDTGGMN